MDNLSQGTTLAILLISFEVIKLLVNKLVSSLTTKSLLTERERFYLKNLHEMHNVKDDQGRPIWYYPSDVSSQQGKIIELINEMSRTQNDTIHVLERIIDKLDRIEK